MGEGVTLKKAPFTPKSSPQIGAGQMGSWRGSSKPSGHEALGLAHALGQKALQRGQQNVMPAEVHRAVAHGHRSSGYTKEGSVLLLKSTVCGLRFSSLLANSPKFMQYIFKHSKKNTARCFPSIQAPLFRTKALALNFSSRLLQHIWKVREMVANPKRKNDTAGKPRAIPMAMGKHI